MRRYFMELLQALTIAALLALPFALYFYGWTK